jgi:hypothetical protein
MGIAEGHADIFVAKEVLNGFEVDAVHNQMAGEGVAEIVKAEICDTSVSTGGFE